MLKFDFENSCCKVISGLTDGSTRECSWAGLVRSVTDDFTHDSSIVQ